jgi:hypothetical protein
MFSQNIHIDKSGWDFYKILEKEKIYRVIFRFLMNEILSGHEILSRKGVFNSDYQLDCSPACKPDQSYQFRLEAAMSTTALPNFIIIILIINTV